MLEKTQARALPLLNKTVDLTPAVSVCCGACRTCMTTNVLTLVGAGVVGLAVYARRFARRILGRSYCGHLLGSGTETWTPRPVSSSRGRADQVADVADYSA